MCYLVGALFAVLRRKIYRYSLSLDDAEEIEQRNMLTAFCNGRYYGGGFYPVPSADPSDGWMDVLTVEPMGRLHTLPLLAKAVHLDPALMASPLITTIVDICSLLVLFAVATEVLHV